jgi:hypothetical protein
VCFDLLLLFEMEKCGSSINELGSRYWDLEKTIF